MELLDCALIGVCAVIRLNTVCCYAAISGVPVCELVQLYTGCVNSTSEDVPLVMKQSINHLAAVMKEPLATVCKHEGKKNLAPGTSLLEKNGRVDSVLFNSFTNTDSV